MCQSANAAPKEPPASAAVDPDIIKIFQNLPLATQFNATPPAKHKF